MAKIRDLTGQTFGKLTVVNFAGRNKWGNRTWLCKCECGNEKAVRSSNLTAGKTKSCGCAYIKDLAGQVFGKLTVVSLVGSEHRNRTWLCKCECGNEKTVTSNSLTSGKTKSCGCINIKDLAGKKFGKLTVVSFAGSNKHGHAKWLCKCECGNEKTVTGNQLASGKTKSCGCINIKDLAGQTFGKLTVVSLVGSNGMAKWLCKCECGNEKTVAGSNLTRGDTKSCGCLVRSEHRQLREKGIFTKRTNSYGYVTMHYPEHPNSWKDGSLLEHTYVMSEYLGRPLKPNENVHHINGVRDDNRIENLELWCKSQPRGQRVNEKQAFYVEFISGYNGAFLQDAKTEHLQGALEAIKIELERRNKCNTHNENTQSSLRQVQLNG